MSRAASQLPARTSLSDARAMSPQGCVPCDGWPMVGCGQTRVVVFGRMQCATHPSVETELACGKCGKPICPRCLYYTPVGVRCRQCANLRRLPQYDVPIPFLLRAAGAALVAGVVLGGLWGLLIPFSVYFIFGLVLGLGLGYGVGEAVSLTANRKVGPVLQAVAAAGVVVAFLTRDAVLASSFRGISFGDIVTNDVFGLIVVVVGAVVAVSRVR